jgi:hypothetical protein
MGGKNSGRQRKPALPAGTYRPLDGSIAQGPKPQTELV